jgi:MFS family permease
MENERTLRAVYAGVTGLVALCQVLFIVDYNAATVALASIGKGLNIAPALLSWVMSSYFLSYAGLLILGGKIGDVYGRRLPCMLGLCAFGAGSLAAFLSPNFPILVIARGVEGLGCAFMIPTTFSLINVVLPEGQLRHRAFAVYGASQGLAVLLGLGLGGTITTHLGWRFIFLLNMPVVLVTLYLTWRFIPVRQENTAKAKLDTAGAVLVTAAIALVLFGLSESGHKGLYSDEALIGLVGATLMFIAFALLERRLKEPLLPFSIFSYANLAGANLASAASAGSTAAVLVLLNLYMQQVMHFTAMRSGLAMIPFALGIVVTGHLLGPAMARLPLRVTIFAGAIAMIIGTAMLSIGAVSPNYTANIAPAITVFSFGATATSITLMALSTNGVAPGRQGLATGLLITCQQIGIALGVSVCLTVLNAGLAEHLSLTKAFARGFMSAASMATLGLVFVALLTRQPRKSGLNFGSPGEVSSKV